jgi:ADP-ribosyl-[dinitrogen reductase] hydrolase
MFRYRHDRASRPARYRHTGDPIAGPTDPPSGTAASCDWRQCRLFFFPDEALGEKYWAKSCLTADGGRNVWTTLVCWRACWSAPRQDAVRALSSLWSRNAHLVTSSRAPLTREHFGKGESDIRGSGYVVEFGGGLLVLFRRRISKQQFSEPQSLVMMRIRPRQHLLYSRLYGESAIPDKWLTRLYLRERIRDVADALYSLSGAGRVRKVNALQRPRRASADADDRERVTRPICPLAHGGPA